MQTFLQDLRFVHGMTSVTQKNMKKTKKLIPGGSEASGQIAVARYLNQHRIVRFNPTPQMAVSPVGRPS